MNALSHIFSALAHFILGETFFTRENRWKFSDVAVAICLNVAQLTIIEIWCHQLSEFNRTIVFLFAFALFTLVKQFIELPLNFRLQFLGKVFCFFLFHSRCIFLLLFKFIDDKFEVLLYVFGNSIRQLELI